MKNEQGYTPRDTLNSEDVAASTPTEIWSEPDQALHNLLDAVFKDGKTECESPQEGRIRPWTDITPFLDHGEAACPGDLKVEMAPGQRLGRFRIERELGRGGFGIVYLAFDVRLGRRVALKVPRPDRVQNSALWGRFAREARLAATLDHEAIVPVLDAGVIEGVFFIATSYQEGEPLSRWLARSPGGLAPRLAAILAERLASGLAHAHGREVLHRDLKPDNVLMVPPESVAPGFESTPGPKITDYGLGTFREPREPGTLTGVWQGSPPYMAPEQVLTGAGPVDARADLYALGAILYEMLTGRPIYPCRSLAELGVRLHRGDPPIAPRQLRRGVPRDLETVCMKCLERDPAARYASAEALQDDLQRYLAGCPIFARPISPWGRVARWARRNPSLAALAGLSTVTLVAWLGLSTRHQIELAASNARLSRTNVQLEDYVERLNAANRQLTAALDDIHQRDLERKRQRYADAMSSASSLLAGGGREAAQAVLRRQIPRPREDDPREFAWYHLWAEATQDYTVLGLAEPSSIVPDPAYWAERMSRGQSQSPRLCQSAEWIRIDPSGLSVHDRAGSYFLTQGKSFAQLDLEEKRVRYQDDAGGQFLDGVRGRPLLSTDGRTLVLAVRDRYADVGGPTPPIAEVRQVRLASGPTLKLVQVPDALRRVISADGRILACLAFRDPCRVTCSLLVYDLANGRGTAVPNVSREQCIVDESEGGGRHRYATTLAISPDGRRVALNDQTTHIEVVDARDGRTLWKAGADLFGPRSLVTALSFSPDGRHVVSGDARGMVRLWDAESGHPCATAPFTLGPLAAVGFYPDGGTVAAVAHGENSIRFWPISPKPEPPAAMNHGDEVWDLAFLPRGAQLISAGDDNRIRLWDVGRGAPVRTIGAHETLIAALATSPDGKALVSADYGGHVRLRDLGRIDAPVRSLADFPGKVRTLAWSPDGRHLAIGGNAPVIHVWERETDRVLRVTPPHEDTFGLAWSPDGSVLAAASHQRRISLWRWPDRTLVQVLESRDPLTCLDFSRDGKALVAGDSAGGLHSFVRAGTLFSPATSRQASGVGGVWDLDFSPDGRTLATASDDGSVRLWDPSGLRDLCRLARPAGKVHALAFSPTGRHLASADFQGLISIHRAGPPDGD